jgi:hypothetical protein
MDKYQETDNRLWEYIDGHLPAKEKSAVEELLASNADWKARYKELLELHQMVQSAELETPSMRFSKNVMEKIANLHIAPAAKSYINKKIIWGIGFFFIALMIGFLVYGFGQADWSSDKNLPIPEKFTNIDFTRFFSNAWVNGFMMVNVVLGLFLLDNYLNRKRKEFKRT